MLDTNCFGIVKSRNTQNKPRILFTALNKFKKICATWKKVSMCSFSVSKITIIYRE